MATIVLEDFYSILQIPQSAAPEAIRESYKRLALRYHPDKNKSPNATKDFQCLVRAWECLRDEKRRREYDDNYWVVKIGLGVGVNLGSAAGASGGGGGGGGAGNWKRKRGWEGGFGEEGMRWNGQEGGYEEEEEDTERARRRREDGDPEASSRFHNEEEETHFREAKEKTSKTSQERKWKARAWKVMARQDYLSRLSAWKEKRTQTLTLLSQCEEELKNLEADLEKQMRETDQEITKRFYEAAQKSRAAGAIIQDEHLILKKLLLGRRAYAHKLETSISLAKTRREEIISAIQSETARYENEEAKARQARICEALGILGPRDQKCPLFSMLDRRGQAINFWRALSRVKPTSEPASPSSTCPLPDINKQCTESPWHKEGDWKRVVGEQTCGRCLQSSFQLIEECAAAECPGCGVLACHGCWRDLMLLREYSEWLCCEGDEMADSLFEVGV